MAGKVGAVGMVVRRSVKRNRIKELVGMVVGIMERGAGVVGGVGLGVCA